MKLLQFFIPKNFIVKKQSKTVFHFDIRYLSNFFEDLQICDQNLQQKVHMKPKDKKDQDNSPISDFNGHYQFLNNDFPSWVALDQDLYPSVSIAYQASRTCNKNIRQQFMEVQTYVKFKEISLSISNPSDWAQRKYKIMQTIIRDKFKRNKQLGAKLGATNPRKLINSYKEGGENQEYWGVVNQKGFNALGNILMSIREQIIKGVDWDLWIVDHGVQSDSKMWPEASLTVLKDDKPIDKLFLQKKNKLFFGAMPTNDFKLDHPSISKIHACIYFGIQISLVLVDLGSSHGTTLIRGQSTTKIETMKPITLQQGDLIIFGLSSRKYRVEISLKKVEDYLRQKQLQIQKERKEIALQMYKNKRSRSRSRSPKDRKRK